MSDLTAAQVEDLRRRFLAVQGEPPVLLTPLPLRTRAKLRLQRYADAVGIWLAEHCSPELAIWWWKACRLW
jgi:hypothetical protein